MTHKINIAKFLKDCPKGMELDSPVYDELTFDYVNEEQARIYCKTENRDTVWFTVYGCVSHSPWAKCVIFPKDKTTWEGFVSPIKPKFKVGDRIAEIVGERKGIILFVDADKYHVAISDETGIDVPFQYQDDWELAPNKFEITTLKPFDKVLVRYSNYEKWCASFFSHIEIDFYSHCYKLVTMAGKSYSKMTPYEGNEHLLGTTNDCDDYYKTWEE